MKKIIEIQFSNSCQKRYIKKTCFAAGVSSSIGPLAMHLKFRNNCARRKFSPVLPRIASLAAKSPRV